MNVPEARLRETILVLDMSSVEVALLDDVLREFVVHLNTTKANPQYVRGVKNLRELIKSPGRLKSFGVWQQALLSTFAASFDKQEDPVLKAIFGGLWRKLGGMDASTSNDGEPQPTD
jgi:hypothetical protein